MKENIEMVGRELGKDEELLTSVFRLEAWVRKYRIGILVVLLLALLTAVGFGFSGYLKEKRALETTAIFDALMEEGVSEEGIKGLAGRELHDFILLKEAMGKGDEQALERLLSSSNAFVAKVAGYELASLKKRFGSLAAYEGFEELILLQEQYQLILEGKRGEAEAKLNAMPLDARLRDLALRIGHYGL